MKRLLTLAAAAALIGGTALGTAAEAAPQHHYDHGRYEHRDRDDHNRYGHDRYGHDRYERHDRYASHRWSYDRGYRHTHWRRGGYVPHDYWGRGRRIDYRYYHLRRPPYGYEWRYVDGDYVMASIATGLIASIVLAQ
ncbi:MAG: RcnB family protein [Asticcacaulis sp.]|uniref:RcnB family protein n=1 Tax=Asticcacaulis sp. TaxID=1872648 RepID=UPI003F7B6B09